MSNLLDYIELEVVKFSNVTNERNVRAAAEVKALHLSELNEILSSNGVEVSPIFGGKWYLQKYTDVAEEGHHPLAHFIAHGAAERRQPHPLFDVDWYLGQVDEADAVDPLLHYLKIGRYANYSPHALFDPIWFERQTCLKNRSTNDNRITNKGTVFDLLKYTEIEAVDSIECSPFICSAWYKEQTELAQMPCSAAEHYLTWGRFNGVSPHPLFDVQYYLECNPDVADSGKDPFEHFVVHGLKEERAFHPLINIQLFNRRFRRKCADSSSPFEIYLRNWKIFSFSPCQIFDSNWYMQTYRDYDSEGLDPLSHYLLYGVAEGIDPSPNFSIGYYAAQEAISGNDPLQPLKHFLAVGIFEGRQTKPIELNSDYISLTTELARSVPKSLNSSEILPGRSEKIKKVAFVGQSEYFRCHYEADLDNRYQTFDKQLLWNADVDYYCDLLDFEPDITFVFRGELMDPEALRRLSGIKVAISSEPFPKYISGKLSCTDDSFGRFEFFRENINCREYDYLFHYDPVSRSFLDDLGFHLSGYFALPIATNTYHPVDGDHNRDILFLGRSTRHREEYLGLLKRDFDVLHLAHGWPSAYRQRVVSRDLLPMISSFKLVLNLHAEDEISWEPRMQQMLACGPLVVSEPISPNEILVPGLHFLECRSPTDLYNITKETLSRFDSYKSIREAGLQRVRSHLAAERWWSNLIEGIVSGHYPRHLIQASERKIGALRAARSLNGFPHLISEMEDGIA